MPTQWNWPTPQLACYSAHLEVFSTIPNRIHELSHIFQDIQERYPLFDSNNNINPVLLFGDMNTVGHLVARAPIWSYSKGLYRWILPPFATEPEIWHRFVLSRHVVPHDTRLAEREYSCTLPKVDGIARNPGLWDPWNVKKDVTLERGPGIHVDIWNGGLDENTSLALNRSSDGLDIHGSWSRKAILIWKRIQRRMGVLFWGKLDWTLVRGVHVVKKRVGNGKYMKSDHRWMMLDINPESLTSSENGSNIQNLYGMANYGSITEVGISPLHQPSTTAEAVDLEVGQINSAQKILWQAWFTRWLEYRHRANENLYSAFSLMKVFNKQPSRSHDLWLDAGAVGDGFGWWCLKEWSKFGIGVSIAGLLLYTAFRRV